MLIHSSRSNSGSPTKDRGHPDFVPEPNQLLRSGSGSREVEILLRQQAAVCDPDNFRRLNEKKIAMWEELKKCPLSQIFDAQEDALRAVGY